MIAGPIRPYAIVQLGDFDMDEGRNAFGLATEIQTAFKYEVHPLRADFDKAKYRLSNGSFDLDIAAKDLLKRFSARPLIFVTSLPYGTKDHAHEAEPAGLFFSDEGLVADRDVSIISTYLWTSL